MKLLYIVGVCLLFCSVQAGERVKLAEEYLIAKGTPELLENTISGMVDKQIRDNPELAPYRMVVLEYFRKSLSFDVHKKELIALYAEKFSADELRELIRTVKTPLGKKLAVFERELGLKLSLLNEQKLMENLPGFQKKLKAIKP